MERRLLPAPNMRRQGESLAAATGLINIDKSGLFIYQYLMNLRGDYPTDKQSTHEAYLPIYEMIFRDYKSPDLMEIGVDGGGSLLMWRDRLHGTVLGMDINPCPDLIKNQRCIIHRQSNAYSEDVVSSVGKFQIIIDDGSHFKEDIQFFVSHYPLKLHLNGICIVEDIQDIGWIPDIAKCVPDGFNHATIDLRTVNGRYDDILFIVWPK